MSHWPDFQNHRKHLLILESTSLIWRTNCYLLSKASLEQRGWIKTPHMCLSLLDTEWASLCIVEWLSKKHSIPLLSLILLLNPQKEEMGSKFPGQSKAVFNTFLSTTNLKIASCGIQITQTIALLKNKNKNFIELFLSEITIHVSYMYLNWKWKKSGQSGGTFGVSNNLLRYPKSGAWCEGPDATFIVYMGKWSEWFHYRKCVIPCRVNYPDNNFKIWTSVCWNISCLTICCVVSK